MKLAVLFCLLCMLAVFSAQSASLYRWVDADGKVHYTDQPPPSSAKKIEEKSLGSRPADDGQLPYASRLAAKNFPVTLYNSKCGEACTKAREHLTKRGIPFAEKDASLPEVQEELKKLIKGLEVPVLMIGRTNHLRGYEAAAWDAALDEAGYPRSVLPSAKPKPKPVAEPAKPATQEEQQSANGNGQGQ